MGKVCSRCGKNLHFLFNDSKNGIHLCSECNSIANAKLDSSKIDHPEQWYYYESNEQKGPISGNEIIENVQNGFLNENLQVWREGMQNWISFSSSALATDQLLHKSCSTQLLTGQKCGSKSLSLDAKVGISLTFWLMIAILALGFFHIVPDAPSGLGIVPKHHFTYALTVVSIEDYCNIAEEHDFAFSVKNYDLLMTLDQEFTKRGWIVASKDSCNISGEEVQEIYRDVMKEIFK